MELRLDAALFVLFGFDASVAVDGVECAASACVVKLHGGDVCRRVVCRAEVYHGYGAVEM